MMLRLHVTRAVFCLATVAAVPTFASAQEAPYVPNFFRLEPQTYDNVPNIPGPNGCVKWCFRDDSPCDPPSFKQADGRCSNTDRR